MQKGKVVVYDMIRTITVKKSYIKNFKIQIGKERHYE